MDPNLLIDRVLDDEGLTSGLDELEAMRLIRAVTDRVRAIANQADAPRRTEELCRAARHIARAVATTPPDERSATLDRLLAGWPK